MLLEFPSKENHLKVPNINKEKKPGLVVTRFTQVNISHVKQLISLQKHTDGMVTEKSIEYILVCDNMPHVSCHMQEDLH